MAPRLGVSWGKPVFREDRLHQPERRKKPTIYFVCSRSDLFHENQDAEWRRAILQVIAGTARHTYLILTKRPQNIYRDWGIFENMWIGTSVEDQTTADERIPILLETSAAHRWVSVEPLIAPISLVRYLPGLKQVVIGCESGPNRRPAPDFWAAQIHNTCRAAGVPCYIKQLAANLDGSGRVIQYPPIKGELAWRCRKGMME